MLNVRNDDTTIIDTKRAVITLVGRSQLVPYEHGMMRAANTSPQSFKSHAEVVITIIWHVTYLPLLFFLGSLFTEEWRRRRPLAPVAFALLSVCLFGWWMHGRAPGELRASFLDVGQGEAALLELPGGGTFLVDSGPSWKHGDAGRFIVAPALRRLGRSRIDTMVITHLHPDHSGGLRCHERYRGHRRCPRSRGRPASG